ncbi:hypothetical protein BS50DRAFT_521010 [Corynespora cassiicola Philippines]|uniref:N-acetyltransferase domain-containing protein n=1 Tax=Corynespora cassiicola Philippines TaxID=1448308 RepID=A0A2T2NTU2_CORCC|nr:hypothetical protein BS50DRAFT_521010 [Corynespora cassiicola Philippines]
MDETKNKVIFRNATAADISSMTTIVPRAYARDATLLRLIPHTGIITHWWNKTYHHALEDPASRLLVAVSGSKVVGVFTMHFRGPDSPPQTSAGIMSAIPLTQDHSLILVGALKELARERRELMGDEPHYLVELVGVDDGYKGLGIGRRLTEWACEIADEQDAAMYLQTTAAQNFYTQKVGLGFELSKDSHDDDAGGTVVRQRKSKRPDFIRA